ncbi:MAG: DNA translocase FtsK [Clostridiales bacterium]|nr:DNA translocase FtsK [Clostridiales bacterium]
MADKKKTTQKKKATAKKTDSRNNSRKNSKKPQSSPDVEKAVQKLELRMEAKAQIKDEILGIILVALGVFLIVALQTKAAGVAGEVISKGLKGLFGFVAFFLPYYFIVYGVLLFLKKTIHIGIKSLIYLVIIYLAIDLVNAARFMDDIAAGGSWGGFSKSFHDGIALDGGGVFGMGVGGLITSFMGVAGLYIFAFVVIFIFLLLLINTPISRFFEGFKVRRNRRILEREERAKERERQREEEAKAAALGIHQPQSLSLSEGAMTSGQRKIMGYMAEDPSGKPEEKKHPGSRPKRNSSGTGLPDGPEIIGAGTEQAPSDPVYDPQKKLTKTEAANSMLESSDFLPSDDYAEYEFPPIDLLKKPTKAKSLSSEGELRYKAQLLEDTLDSFGIATTVTNVIQGPTVTRYEVHPNSGVKVSRIKNLNDDIALNMKARSIRIEAPIPGKDAVGIEIENEKSNAVTVREIIESNEFKNAKSKVTFAVGRDIGGKAIVADLAAMPHLLIAGATGSGKSVCINSIIASILYKARPDEVKMVLIDPKIVELSHYNGIPHLLIPVVTDPAKAAAALNWAVTEMDERYKRFAENGVRDFNGFNRLKAKKKNSVRNGEVDGPMPQVVIIIDELADLMMVSSSQVEESICRIAQKARAAGMHLIVATQRPSVNVITGLIKANIPSRIAFAVTSQVDSRTILDGVGAEKLVGKGDMLFAPLGSTKPTRIQGTFISDEEVKGLIQFVQQQGEVDEAAEADVLDTIERANKPAVEKENNDYGDELLPDAIELVVEQGAASVSMLQRRFRIGYNRAARIIDMMEDRQIVGPPDGSRPRQVLLSKEDLENMKNTTSDM